MDEYFIGAGALLTAGQQASIAQATLHAQTQKGLAAEIKAAVIDFEATQAGEVRRILVVAAGWSGGRFRAEVIRRLIDLRDCSLGDVFSILAEATGVDQIHLFARWRPDKATDDLLAERGVSLCSHPLEAIGQAALVSGQRVERWADGRVQVTPRVRKHDAA